MVPPEPPFSVHLIRAIRVIRGHMIRVIRERKVFQRAVNAMKTKQIYLVVAASILVVPGWAAWRFAAIPEVADPPNNTALPAQKTAPSAEKTTPATSPRTGSPIVSQATETPEMNDARASEQKRQLMASATAETDAQKARIKAGVNARKELSKPDDMAFLKSLGLSDALSDKVYQMIRAKDDFFGDHWKEMSEALRRGERTTDFDREYRQMNADLEAAVGPENYRKIKFWQATLGERNHTASFKRYLAGRNLPLTGQQEAAVVEAMYQARQEKTALPNIMAATTTEEKLAVFDKLKARLVKASFSLISPTTSMEDKLAYIDTVKQRLTPVLSANEVALLGQHLKEVAEKSLMPPGLEKKLPKSLLDKLPMPSNPPAPPR